jgi:hypothetical protein
VPIKPADRSAAISTGTILRGLNIEKCRAR